MSPALQTVHVRVNDAATGKPTPVRIRFTDDAGNYFAPLGRLAEFSTARGQNVGGNLSLGGDEFAYIDGTCEIRLPVGPLHVCIEKGPEYRPIYHDIRITPGKLALRLEIRRWTDARSEGWYSGDACCHALNAHAALLEGAAEDLAVVNVLAELREVGAGGQVGGCPATPNILEFSGQRPALETPGHMVVVNTRNTHPVLGSLLLLNSHRVVHPLAMGGPGQWNEFTLADLCDQCHRKGGLVVADTPDAPEGLLDGEILADAILGKIDALHVAASEINVALLHEWEKLLHYGLHIPLVAGSAKASNAVALGTRRTYAHLSVGEPFTYKNWIEAVRAGRTFITNGAHLFFTVNGQVPGNTLSIPEGGVLHCRAEVRAPSPIGVVEIVADGQPVGRAESPVVECQLPAAQVGWIVARWWVQSQYLGLLMPDAQTSPVYVVSPEGRRKPCPSEVISEFRAALDKMENRMAHDARFDSVAQRARLQGVLANARSALSAR